MTTRSTKTKNRTGSAAARSVPLHQPALGPVEQVPIDLLRPYDRNARTHNQRQIAKIAASLEAFGWMNPLLAEADGTIIAGHGRWTAARTLGMTHVPVIRAEHLSADQARAYRLADNRLAELAGWDDEILTIELQHLSTVDLDYSIEVIGWDHAEIDVMLDPPEKNEGAGPLDAADRDVPPPSSSSAVSRTGDIWLLGPHRLLCGSALATEAFERVMNGAKATMVFADAPYNVPIEDNVSGFGKVTRRKARHRHRHSELRLQEQHRDLPPLRLHPPRQGHRWCALRRTHAARRGDSDNTASDVWADIHLTGTGDGASGLLIPAGANGCAQTQQRSRRSIGLTIVIASGWAASSK